MKLYCYDKETKCYTGTEEASLNIAETEITGKNVYFISANSTEIPIPIFGSNEIPQFNEISKTWTIVKDYRNTLVIDKISNITLYYKELGELPSNLTDILPSDITLLPYLKFDETSQTWIDNIEAYKTKATNERNVALKNSDAKILRYNSEKILITNGLLTKTTNTDEEILEWETYRQQLREFMNTWEKGKTLPSPPDIA